MPTGASARGLLEAVTYVPRERGLVFVISDFHFPLQNAEKLFVALQRHEVVPMPVWSARERELPAFGLVQLRDAEGAGERLLFMRPGLRARVRRSIDAHREDVRALCARFGRRPLELGERFDPQMVTRYFYG